MEVIFIKQSNNEKKIAIGLIGLGYWGEKYLRILRELESIDLKFIVDSDEKRLSLPLEKSINVYTDVNEALKNNSVEGCFIVTPPSTHLDIAKICFSNGINVFVEKPAMLSLKELKEAISLSRRYKKQLYPGHIYAYNRGLSEVRSIISSTDFGRLRYVISSRLGLGPIRTDANVVWDLMIHDLTILDYLGLSSPYEVACVGGSYIQKKIADIANCSIKYKDGTSAFLVASWLSPSKVRQTTIVGENKMIIFDDTSQEFPVKIYDNKIVPTESGSGGSFKPIIRAGDISIHRVSLVEPLKQMILSFLSGINGQSDKSLAELARATRVINVLEKITQSMESGGRPAEIKVINN